MDVEKIFQFLEHVKLVIEFGILIAPFVSGFLQKIRKQ